MADELKVYTDSYFIEDVKLRFKPRDLIMDDLALRNALDKCIEQLDQYVYINRYYELAVGSLVVDLTRVTIPGIEVKKVTYVMSTQNLNSILTVYTQVLGQTPFYYNIIRNQDTFVEFMLTQQLANQLNRRFKSKETMWTKMGDKLLLDGKAFGNDTSVVISFYPHFITKGVKNWEMYSTEAIFVGNLLESLVSKREGRAQSELNFTEFSTNSDKLWEDGKEDWEKIIDKFQSEGIQRLGRRV